MDESSNIAEKWIKCLTDRGPDRVAYKIVETQDDGQERDTDPIIGFVVIYHIRPRDSALFKILLPEISDTINTLTEYGRKTIVKAMNKAFRNLRLNIVYTNVSTTLEDLIELYKSMGFQPLPADKQFDKSPHPVVLSLSMTRDGWMRRPREWK